MRFRAPGEGLIGVDVTSAAVKLVELRRAGGGYQVESYAIRPLREGAVVEQRIDDLGEVIDTLCRAVQQARPRSRRAVVAVPSGAAITKTLMLPASLSDDEIESRIQLDSDKHIPFPFSEVAFDFQRLGDCDAGQQEVLLVACRRQDVSQLADAVRQAGLMPQAVDVETFAVERACAEMSRWLPELSTVEEGVALVDIGATMMTCRVLYAGRVVYGHDSVFEGRRSGEEISGHYGVGSDATEQDKQRGGLPADHAPGVLTSFLDALTQQVGRALQLYHAAGRKQEVRRLVVSGSGARLVGLVERLTQASGLEVSFADPLAGMQVAAHIDAQELADVASTLLTACGLAMRTRA